MNLVLSFENMRFKPGILLLQDEGLIKNIENLFSDSKEVLLVTLYITLYKKWKDYHFGLIKHSESKSYKASLLCDFYILKRLFRDFKPLKDSDIGYYVLGIKDSIKVSHLPTKKSELGSIPDEIGKYRGPSGESNSCFCDSYFVAMFMSTTKNDLPLNEGLAVRDWYDSKPTLFDNGPNMTMFKDKSKAALVGVKLIEYMHTLILNMRVDPDASDDTFSTLIKNIRAILAKFGFGLPVQAIYDGDDDDDKLYFVKGGKLYYTSTTQQEDVVEFNSFITEIIPAFKYWTIPYRVVQTVGYVVVSGSEWDSRNTANAKATLFKDLKKTLNGSYQSIIHLQIGQDGVHTFQELLDKYQENSVFMKVELNYFDLKDEDMKRFSLYYHSRQEIYDEIEQRYPLKPDPVILRKVTTSAEFCSSPDIVLIALNRIVDTLAGAVVTREELILHTAKGPGVIDDVTIKIRRYIDSSDIAVVTYKIVAIVCHIGGLSNTGGHYICYFINNGEWYYYNDSSPRFKKILSTDTKKFLEDIQQNGYFFVTEKVVKYI